MAKAHDRIIELTLVTAKAAATTQVTTVKYYRDRSELAAANGLSLVIDTTAAQVTPAEIQLGELMPPPTHIRFVVTYNA